MRQKFTLTKLKLGSDFIFKQKQALSCGNMRSTGATGKHETDNCRRVEELHYAERRHTDHVGRVQTEIRNPASQDEETAARKAAVDHGAIGESHRTK